MKPFRIVHFSDIHEARPMRTAGGFLDKRIVGAVNSFFRRRKCFLRANIAPAVERILADPPDAVVFSGDAATCGQPSEFRQALDDLKPLTESGIPLLFSPGNHDAYVRDRACRNALRDFVEELTNGRQTLDGYPSVFDPGPLRFLVFNAARPTNPLLSCGFLDEASQELIRRTVAAAAEHGTAIPVVEPVDSFRETEGEPDAEGVVPSRIVDRRRLRIVQTPQFFRAEVLRRAYETEYRADDASVVEAAGYRVCLAEGERGNLKLTTPEDFTVAEALIAAREEAGEERTTTDAEHL